MEDKTIVKLFTLGCAVIIVMTAMFMGHNGNLATLTVLGLFGGEKLLSKVLERDILFSVKKKKGEE